MVAADRYGIAGVAGRTAPPGIPSDRGRAAYPHLERGAAGILEMAAIRRDPFWAATHRGTVAGSSSWT